MSGPVRWVDADPKGAVEGRAAELIRSWSAGEPISSHALARIGAELRAPARATLRTAPRRAWFAGAAVLLASLAFAGTARYILLARVPAAAPAPSPVRAVVSVRAPESVVEPLPEPAAPEPPVVLKPAAQHRPPKVNAVLEESRLLGLALGSLRQDGDPRAALATLDRYQKQFPEGTLAREAQMTRLDALLALGERAQALALLDRMNPSQLDRMPRSTELEALRVELLAEAGRCAEALSLIDRLLERGASEFQDRIVAAQARCRL